MRAETASAMLALYCRVVGGNRSHRLYLAVGRVLRGERVAEVSAQTGVPKSTIYRHRDRFRRYAGLAELDLEEVSGSETPSETGSDLKKNFGEKSRDRVA